VAVAHPSDSQEQRSAEGLILSAVSAGVGTELIPRSLKLDGGARVDVDGVSPDETVFVEVIAHQGRLKGAQSACGHQRSGAGGTHLRRSAA
jgi:hypothetical protein